MIYGCLPPLDEQAAIVRYLDHADRRISRYIRAKQRLIELLEEEKQVIIHRAVTRGLDPDVRLKPSGVEWLGGRAGALGGAATCGIAVAFTGHSAASFMVHEYISGGVP